MPCNQVITVHTTSESSPPPAPFSPCEQINLKNKMIFHLLSLGNSIFNRWHSYPCFRGVAPCTGQCLLQTMNWQQTTLPRSKGTSGKLVVSTNDNIAVEGSQGSIFLALMVTCALHRLATWRWRPLFQQTHIPAPCKITRTKRQLQPCKFQLKVSLEPKESTAQGTCRAAGTICGFTEGCQGHQCGFTEKRHNYCLMPATALPLRVRHAGDGGIFGPSVPATAASLVPVTLPRREGADAQCPVRIWNIYDSLLSYKLHIREAMFYVCIWNMNPILEKNIFQQFLLLYVRPIGVLLFIFSRWQHISWKNNEHWKRESSGWTVISGQDPERSSCLSRQNKPGLQTPWELPCHGLQWLLTSSQEIACEVSLQICKKTISESSSSLDRVSFQDPDGVSLGTRSRLLIIINQMVASVVKGATTASWHYWVTRASSKLGVSFYLNKLRIPIIYNAAFIRVTSVLKTGNIDELSKNPGNVACAFTFCVEMPLAT